MEILPVSNQFSQPVNVVSVFVTGSYFIKFHLYSAFSSSLVEQLVHLTLRDITNDVATFGLQFK